MSDSAGFMEDVLKVEGGGDIPEPKIDQLKSKLTRLQQAKQTLEKDINERESLSESLQKELDTLRTEAYQLEKNHQEKEALCRKLRFQCEESEHESVRLAEENKKREELLARHRCEIQELKLKKRKMRVKFENHLHQLMEQHKKLYSIIKDSQQKQ
ncbi:synaptonemal complex central element protein 1 [Dunckerocampus dactyliophorus]|uniref:synaptonemal complex central element protein 1 n=1 Tax=Dunckerocampus dactyliophorus TaxID=161453 RepID=UPI002406DD7A|nr:synaptonemal complex central element protein 1 [Dunckerocampus dactyliophorus]